MNFIWKAKDPLRTPEQVAKEIHKVSIARDLDTLATVMAVMCVSVESGFWCPANKTIPESFNFPHDSESDDENSVGYFQQRIPWWGTVQEMMTLDLAANTFLSRLTNDWWKAASNPALAGEMVANVQRCADQYRYRYATKWNESWSIVNRALSDPNVIVVNPTPEPVLPLTPVGEPDFVEKNLIGVHKISSNRSPRNSTNVDLLLVHTTEGSGGMNLVNYMAGAEVSYHYLIDNDEDGNTVYDLVDTDYAAWSVLSANRRSINYVIGRSTVNWSRQDWINKARNAIKIMAWLMIQDAQKYNIPLNVIAPDPNNTRLYRSDPPGISDHKYVTFYLRDGSHTDVGLNFPWDLLKSDIEELSGKDTEMDAQTKVWIKEVRDKLLAYPDNPAIGGRWPSRAMFRQSDVGIDDTIGMGLNTDGSSWDNIVIQGAFLEVPWCLDIVQGVIDGKLPGSNNPKAVEYAKALMKYIQDTPNTKGGF